MIGKEEEGSLGFATIVTRPYEDKADSQYLATFLNTYKHKQWAVSMSTGDGRTNYNLREYCLLNVPVCSLEEQEKIGALFKTLDRLITLQESQVQNHKTLKQAMLQKMFPKEGERVPEIRFQGFEGEWKRTLLKDISQKVTEKNTDLKYGQTFTNSADFGIIKQEEYFDHRISNEKNSDKYYIVRPNDFIYNPRISSSAPYGPINCNRLNEVGIMSPLYYVFRVEGVSVLFLENYFKTSLWHRYLHNHGNRGARHDRLAITDANFIGMSLLIPGEAEQKKNGAFFQALDKTIQGEEEKLASYKRLKTALMQKIFL